MGDEIDQGIPVVLLWLDEGIEPSAEMFGAAAQDLTHGPEIWPQFDQAFRNAMNMPRTTSDCPGSKLATASSDPTN